MEMKGGDMQFPSGERPEMPSGDMPQMPNN